MKSIIQSAWEPVCSLLKTLKKTLGEEFWKIAEKDFVLRFVVASIRRVLAVHVQGMLMTVIKWFS